jgi:hypothetical protein
VALVLLAGMLVLGVVACGHKTAGPTVQAPPPLAPPVQRSITVTDKTWHCHGPVDLDVVRVVVHGTSKDAVHLDKGCTGTIRTIQVVGDGGALGPGGDGVKIHAGAHDLRILGGFINCGAKGRGVHQDAIQAMGGEQVVFHSISSRGCANAFMFINQGRGDRGIPRGIVCERCRAQTDNYSVFLATSIQSGARTSSFVARFRPRARAGAVEPVLDGNTWTQRSSGLE